MVKTKEYNFWRNIVLVIILLLTAYFFLPQSDHDIDITLVGFADTRTPADFDVEQYVGVWHELARYNEPVEKDCICVTATYALVDDYVSIQNSCFKNSKFSTVTGKAFLTDTPGVFEVEFNAFAKGDYRVVYIDRDYENAIVSNSAQTSLWFLSKDPKDFTIAELTLIAQKKGFDTSKLIYPEGC